MTFLLSWRFIVVVHVGSGKHNNWSIGSNKIPTFMDPGNDPLNNRVFMLTLAAVIRAVGTALPRGVLLMS